MILFGPYWHVSFAALAVRAEARLPFCLAPGSLFTKPAMPTIPFVCCCLLLLLLLLLLFLLLLLLLLLKASRLRRGQASTVRLFLARHGKHCQSLSCSGPKSGGKHASATELTCFQR